MTEKPKPPKEPPKGESGYSSKLGPIPPEHFDNEFPPPDEETAKHPTAEWLDHHVATTTPKPKPKPTGAPAGAKPTGAK